MNSSFSVDPLVMFLFSLLIDGLSMALTFSLGDRFTSNVVLFLRKRKTEKENGGQDMTDYNEKEVPVEKVVET